MGVYEYRGEPGLGYLRLACAHGTAPVTGLEQGDLVDFGEHEPPDGRWVEAPEGTAATKLPDNHPDNQPVVQYPEPGPEDAKPVVVREGEHVLSQDMIEGDADPQDAKPTEPVPAPATDAPKRSKTTPAKTTA